MDSPDFALFGPGRIGLQLAHRLVGLGWSCTAIRGRRLVGPEHHGAFSGTVFDTWDRPLPWAIPGLTLVCVGDPQIEQVSRMIAGTFEVADRVILHTSGLHTSDVLATCRDAGAMVASWHPLQTFPATGQAATTSGVPCAIEGSPAAVLAGEALAHQLGMIPWPIDPAAKPLYHAAAAVAGNLTHVLVKAAAELMEDCGLPAREGDHPLQPLITSAVNAALDSPGFTGLTGAISRGDGVSIQHHLNALPDPLARAYAALRDYVEEQPGSADLD